MGAGCWQIPRCRDDVHSVAEFCQEVTIVWLLLGHLRPSEGSGITDPSVPLILAVGQLRLQVVAMKPLAPQASSAGWSTLFSTLGWMTWQWCHEACPLSSESKRAISCSTCCRAMPRCCRHESDNLSLFWPLFHRSLTLPNKSKEINNLSYFPFPCQGMKKPSRLIVSFLLQEPCLDFCWRIGTSVLQIEA